MIVQKMIGGVVSGVAFSMHPVTHDKNQILIEGVFGLGESLVSGRITPDSYILEKKPLTIISKNIFSKPGGFFRFKNGKNVWRNLSGPQRIRQVISDKEIISLAKIIIKIEKHFQFPCDVEWTYAEGRFYIVQSRAITVTNGVEQEYRQIMVRPFDLIACECWDAGERLHLPRQFKGLLYFDPLFIYKPGQAVTIYYNFTDPKQDLLPLLQFLENNLAWFTAKKAKFDQYCKKIRRMMRDNISDYKMIYKTLCSVWPMIAVANIFGSTQTLKISPELKETCIKIREESDDVLHPALSYISAFAKKRIGADFPEATGYLNFISLSEIISGHIPKKEILTKRSKGYLFHKGIVYLDTEGFLKENNIRLVRSDNVSNYVNLIKGQSACQGIAKGRAKIVLELDDLKKIDKGNVIVTPMTTPDMTVALRTASAIVTNEGGITSHAAIVARELQKPCVIGTRIATKLIKNGDMLEVDGTAGTVKILKTK